MVGEVATGFDLALLVLLFHHLKERLKSPVEREQNTSKLEPSEKNVLGLGEAELLSSKPQVTHIVQWEPTHSIFLSHSGEQKEFTRILFNALINAHYSPFFDASDKSLCKGEKWFKPMMDAARQCRVAIVVLSDDFFLKSKWPMMELNEFAKAQEGSNPNLKVLPLYLGITFEQFNKSKENWLNKWKEWRESDKRIDLDQWEKALTTIKRNNPLTYENEGWDTFIKKVVETVCKLVEPNVKFSVPENQSIQLLCEPILEKMKDIAPSSKYKVKVMGLHGMGGIGKTTISRAICNAKFSEYGGRVSHIELGHNNSLEVQKLILKDLSHEDSTTIEKHHDKLDDLLKNCMKKQSVLLVLDNVQSEQVPEVIKYLEIQYDDKSVVLITSRSEDILFQLHIDESNCMEMPPLDDDSALAVFSYYLGDKSIEKDSIIKEYVAKCCFVKGGSLDPNYNTKFEKQYVPLALKVLGSQLQRIVSQGEESEKFMEKHLEKLKGERFNMLREKNHPIFSILRLGFDALCLEDQYIFLDLALLWTPQWRSWGSETKYMWDWMCIFHRKTQKEMKECISALKRNGLLDSDNDYSKLTWISIHDLYIEFAEVEAQGGPFKKRKYLIDKEGIDVPFELLKKPSGLCWSSLERLIIHSSKVKSFTRAKLEFCSNVEVLYLYNCKELVEIDVGSLENLRSLEIGLCAKLDLSNYQVRKLINLNFLQLSKCPGAFVYELLKSSKRLLVLIIHNCSSLEDLDAIIGASALQKLRVYKCDDLKHLPSDFSSLEQLEEVSVLECMKLLNLGDIEALKALKKLNVEGCKSLEVLPHKWKGLKQLEELNVSWCEKLKSLGDIQSLEALKKVNASRCENLEMLPKNLSGLKQLQDLDVSGCKNLVSLGDIEALKALKKFNACGCENLEMLPKNLSGLKYLQDLNVSWCKNLVRLGDIQSLEALKELNAWRCKNLEMLPKDLSGLKQLEDLNVSECMKLVSLGDIQSLESLKKLDASGCESLEMLPEDLSRLKQLEDLNVCRCMKLVTLGDIQSLNALKRLNVSYCRSLKMLPEKLSGLKQLVDLDVHGCEKLVSLGDIQSLEALKKLNVLWCGSLEMLPMDLSGLKQLEDLYVSECMKLVSLGDIQSLEALKRLNISDCRSLEMLPENLSGLKQLEELNVVECKKLGSLGDIQSLESLKKLDASRCVSLEMLPKNLSGLKQLEDLNVSGCKKLVSLGDIQSLEALKKLNAWGCENLEMLPKDLSRLKQLEYLNVIGCEELVSLGDIQSLEALKKLDVSYCRSLEMLPKNLSGLKQLEDLNISGCKKLVSLGGIQSLEALKKLNAPWCKSLEMLPENLSGLKQLEILNVSGCMKLVSLGDIQSLHALKRLNVSYCRSLEMLSENLSGLKQLEELNVVECWELVSLGDIQSLESLKKLDASGCVSLEMLLENLSGLNQLEDLNVSGCKKLVSLGDIQSLEALKKLNARWCESLEMLPGNLSELKQLQDLDVRGCKKLKNLGDIQSLRNLNELGVQVYM